MITAEKITLVKTLINDDIEATDAVVSVYLLDAKSAIMLRRYPFGTTETEIPAMYDVLQCKLAARYFFRRGVEGQISSAENGISRGYGSVNDEDLLSEVTQIVRLV